MSWIIKRDWLHAFPYLAGDPREGTDVGYAQTQDGAHRFSTLEDAKAALRAHPKKVEYTPRIVRLRERPRCPHCDRPMPKRSET